MDLQYILFNTVVYGIIASCLAGLFAFGKILNLSLGGFLVALGYILHSFIVDGFTTTTAIVAVVIIGIYLLINRVLLKKFPHQKQRDHVSIVATLGLTIVLENAMSFIYGPNSVSIDIIDIGPWTLGAMFIILLICFYYFFKHTSYGVIFKGIFENAKTLRGMGFKVDNLLQGLFLVLFVLLGVAAFLIINEVNLRSSDGLFYLIKGIGIMIIVGVQKKEYMFLGALLYVVTEYLLFVQGGLPISYKETLILAVILLILLFKPEGLFTLRKRKF